MKVGKARLHCATIPAPSHDLKDLKCILTLLKGNIVYRDTQRLP